MTYPRKWEEITDEKYAGCARLKIFGGWLVVAWINDRERLPESLVFVPDSRHQWELE